MAQTGPVERKVTWGTLGAYFGSVAGLAVAEAVTEDTGLLTPLPDWLEVILLPLLPTVVTYLSAYRAKHTWRSDPDALKARDAAVLQ